MTTTYPRHSLPDNPCRHDASLYGRCVDCGLTWGEQHRRADVRRAIAARVDERRAGRIMPRRRIDLMDITAVPRVLLDSLRIGGAL